MKRGEKKKDAEIEVPEILPPTDDAVFKTLMTHPDTRDCLKDMIICYTGVRVQRVDLLNNELPVSNIMEKMERLDVFRKGAGPLSTFPPIRWLARRSLRLPFRSAVLQRLLLTVHGDRSQQSGSQKS
jgi:hypothetical protein